MASYKSQSNLPRRVDESSPYTYRAPTSRLPQKSVTPTPTSTSQLPAPGYSKLQKKRPTRDDPALPSRTAISQRVPVARPAVATKSRQGSAPTAPSSRLPKPDLPASTRTPSLVSGSSTSTVESPRSNVLRRKPSSIGVSKAAQPTQHRGGSMSSQEEGKPSNSLPGVFKDPFSETVLGISLPATSTILTRSDSRIELQGDTVYDYEVGPTEILPLPTPQYALSTTPSTRYSESPGPFSVSSTPTSMSSYSPGVILSSKTRVRQASPLQGRPPLSRQNTPDDSRIRPQRGLSSVRESSTSSSSTSTVIGDGSRSKDRQATQRLPPPPPSPQSKTGSRPQAPPELAHLADDPPLASDGPRRPIRPSRNGTAEIVGLREPSPIIQSNMTSFPSSHRRTSSTESKMAMSSSSRPRFGMPSKSSSRNPSPSLSLASPPLSSSRLPTREPTPDMYADADARRSQTLPSSQTTAPSPGKSSRFGFFRRKTEPAPATKPEKKLHRRGPAAGTGHEGYGRYAVRGRSGSSVSGSSIGRSASAGTTTESLNHTPSSRKSSFTSTASTEVDDFFLERLAPVTIRGTGNSTERLASPDSIPGSSSLELSHRVGDEQQRSSNTPGATLEQKKPTLLPSAMSDPVRGASPMKRMPLGSRRPSESDDDSKRSFLPSLTARRTSRASKVVDGGPLSKVVSSSSVTDQGSKSKSGKGKAEKATTKPSRKWNFFQRAQATSKVEPAVETAAVSRVHPSKSVAHYALIDAPAGIDMEDIEQIMQEANNLDDDSPPEERLDNSIPGPVTQPKERLHSMLLPPKPLFPSHLATPNRPASPKVYLRAEMPPMPSKPSQPALTVVTNPETVPIPPPSVSLGDLTPVTDLSPPSSPFRPLSPMEPSEPAPIAPSDSTVILPDILPPPGPPSVTLPPRPSRLAQVGRIPQVVSSRKEEHRPPSRSFSRPFLNNSPIPRTSFDPASPLPATAGPVEPYPVLQGLDVLSHGLAIATLSPNAEASNRQSEFFKFPPRKDSEVSYSSSSGAWSFPPTCGTAVIPGAGAPQSEDEVWREYDDLIDEVLSPLQVGTVPEDQQDLSRHPSLEPLPLKPKDAQASTEPSTSEPGPSNLSLHLRRSRLLAVLHSAQSPTSPISLSDFIQDYPDQRLSVVDPVTGRLSLPTSGRMSTGSVPQKRPSSNRSSLPASLTLSARQSRATIASTSDKNRASGNSNRYRDTRLMELAENQSDGLVSMANLRFGALMTSKWLSFGRVLFSPAHFELKDPTQDRVLVIDGLGKDWSYYCALTYPEASVYNLGPGMSSSNTPGTSEPWSTLRNHHHVCHENLSAPFPYPRGFFACVVLRFPPALPSSVHRFVVSECKRVLRPGGHLELSVLDLDLVNMGNRARRAIRGLKVKMQVADENISLRNISDEIMAALGRKGFVECNRCFVGVPVAGRLPNPEDSEDGKKRKGSTASSLDKSKGTPKRKGKAPKPEVSFSDLLNKHSSTGSTDDGITDMVARVGRWWYSRCYESLVLPEAGEPDAATSGNLLESSIWRDEALVNECEKRGTSFRLLIGYAQKPEVGVRRTVSV